MLLQTCGLVGLWRLEWEPKVLQLGATENHLQDRRHSLQQASVQGTRAVYITLEKRDAPIEELIKQAESDHALVTARLSLLDRIAIRKYKVQKWSFVLGVLGLLVPRGYVPLVAILFELRTTP